MGISGLYTMLKSRKPIPLIALAVEAIQTGQPLRLAVDISIWLFQAQAAKGGKNPAIRVIFCRLVRLLGLPIRAIFIFDGPAKPRKKNKQTGASTGPMTAAAKELIQLFGFPVHNAPGEAEAECALLQHRGIVDAVLSEDVDTFMFRCTMTMRDPRLNRLKPTALTSVLVYNSLELKDGAKLDREGIVLVALLSGGDYSPGGIPGFGVKISCEAAVAGYGKSLCRIRRSDTVALANWKQSLQAELRTNESGFFQTKHRKLKIPKSFPDFTALHNYLHPRVSTEDTLNKLTRDIQHVAEANIGELRDFTRDRLGWDELKLVRTLSPSLLMHRLYTKDRPCPADELGITLEIAQKRTKLGVAEYQVHYVPIELVQVRLETEEEGNTPFEEHETDSEDKSQRQRKSKNCCDLHYAQTWVPESIIRLALTQIEEPRAESQKAKSIIRKSGMKFGAIEKYLYKSVPPTTSKRAREEDIGFGTKERRLDLLDKRETKRQIIDLTNVE